MSVFDRFAPLRAVAAICFILVATMAACTSAGGSGEDADRVVVFLPGDNPGDILLRNSQAKRFEKENPDIKVDIQVLPARGYNEKVFTSISDGNPPDIFASGDIVIPTIAARNLAYDLNDFVEEDKSFKLSGYYPEVIDGLTYQGELLGLTDNWDTQVMYYNRDLFDKAGLDYPDASWTWNDAVSAARKLTSGEGTDKVFGIAHGLWFVPVFDQIWAYGGDIFNSAGTKCAIADLIKDGVAPTPQELLSQTTLQLLAARRAAMVIDAGRWGAYELLGSKVNWAVAPIPKGPEGRDNFFHLGMFAIARNSDSPDNAWKFLKYIVSNEAIKLSVANMQGVPSRPALARSPLFKNDPVVKEHDALQPFLDSLPTAHTAPVVEDLQDYIHIMNQGLDPVWAGKETAAKALPPICKQIDEQLGKADAD